MPRAAFLAALWIWCTTEEVCAALYVPFFMLVLIGVRVGIFSVSYICKIVFLCT